MTLFMMTLLITYISAALLITEFTYNWLYFNEFTFNSKKVNRNLQDE
jgi:hypothetical protein